VKPLESADRYAKDLQNQNKNVYSEFEATRNELEAIRNSDGWKLLMRYYKFRDKIFPPNTKRRAYAKSLFKVLNRTIRVLSKD
jgi:hypothetical protein